MIFCKDCKWLKRAWISNRFPDDPGATYYSCIHPHCYKVDPRTGERNVYISGSDYKTRNADYECEDFEQKPPPEPLPPRRKRWWHRFLTRSAILLVVLSGCSLQSPQEDYHSLNLWISANIIATGVDGDEFQTPQETLDRGAGDCEDFAYLLLWMVHEMYGVSGELVVYWVDPETLHGAAAT